MSWILQLCLSHLLQTIWILEEAQTLQFGNSFYFHLFDMDPHKFILGRIFCPSVWLQWWSCLTRNAGLVNAASWKCYCCGYFPAYILKSSGLATQRSEDTALLSNKVCIPRACTALVFAIPKGVLAALEEVKQRQNYGPASSSPTKTKFTMIWTGEHSIPAPHNFWICT